MKIIDIAFRDLQQLGPEELSQLKDSDYTLQVPEETPALDIVGDAQKKGSVIFVVDEQGDTLGLVAPNWVQKQISEQCAEEYQDVADALQALQRDPEEIARGYHHEYLTYARPILYECRKGDQPHWIDVLPCPIHEP